MATATGSTAQPRSGERGGNQAPSRGWSAFAMAGAATAVGVWLLVAVFWHLTQGTADVGLGELWAHLTGAGPADQAAAVLTQSRMPRLGAGLLVGSALGIAGAAMQGVARNPLASPDTTGVNAGAYLALTVVAAFGIPLGPLPGVVVAFIGGIATAALVISLSTGANASAVRLVLAGSAITLGLSSITSVLLLLFPWETQGLFAWGAGSLSQHGPGTVLSVLPVAAVAALVLMGFGRRLDLLQLGEDAARSLGMHLGRTRSIAVCLAVLLAACAVTVSGPVGFVGLCAPLLMRLASRWVRPMRRHRVLMPMSAVSGVALVLSADVLLRAAFGPVSGVTVPTGVVTSLIGAVVIIALAQRSRTGLDTDTLVTLRAGTTLGRRRPGMLLSLAGLVLAGALVAAVLLGDSTILLGDVANWLTSRASPRVDIILDTRLPRAGAAVLAGICLALAGGIVQTTTRNPLADPGLLGVSASAGLGAVVVLLAVPGAPFLLLLAGAIAGAVLAGGIVFVLAARGGMDQARMVLVGIGTGAGASAITTLLLVRTDPWNQNKAITWLGGSTYGVAWQHLVPMVVLVGCAAVLLTRTARDLDLVQVDETTPQVLGIDIGASRRRHIALAIALTAVATASIGVIAFVGLVAPHAARMLIGRSHRLMLPLTALLGGSLVLVADTLGRAAIAPAQLPAGLVTALIGTPYFLYLLWRMRADRS